MIRTLLLLICTSAVFAQPVTMFVTPNTHGTVAGWLVDFDTERNYALNNYLVQLDRVKSDPHYTLAYSEVPNLMSMMQFAPERLAELKKFQQQRRVELCNAFFVEPDINLSGGEALVQTGVQGLHWYRDVLGLQPRHSWMIDLTGAHQQFPQIVAGLGLDSVFFNRCNPTSSSAFWWVAPDGTRALTLVNRHYQDLNNKGGLFDNTGPMNDAEFADLRKSIEAKQKLSPSKSSLFAMAGLTDYSPPPKNPAYPAAFLPEWDRRYPDVKIRFGVPSDYVDALKAEIADGRTKLPEYSGDTRYVYNSFWVNMPEVREYYRRDEHLLAAAELLATAASLRGKQAYPAQDFYYSWINLIMNQDRNVIWGAAAGTVFKDPQHWDAWDRFESVERQSKAAVESSTRVLAGTGNAVTLYNPLNWKRTDPVRLEQAVQNATCQALSQGAVCRPSLPSAGVASFKPQAPAPSQAQALPEAIETNFYIARIDPKTGALSSLKLKATGQELLGGPANVIVAEKGIKDLGHFMESRPERKHLASSSDWPATIRVATGPLATQVVVTSDFHAGSKLQRTLTFYRDHPRIDLDTRLDLKTTDVLITADFPLAGDVTEATRGIPYGYTRGGSGIHPVVRWSNYQLGAGAGLAVLDRGLTGRELTGRTVTLGLFNAVSEYVQKSNEMLRGLGVHEFHYALVPHAATWQKAGIPRTAWEFNMPPVLVAGTAQGASRSFLETSPNVIVEAVRRIGSQIEIRLVETDGASGTAEVIVHLPHTTAALTDMRGAKPQPLAKGAAYRFPIRPQQIVTLRLETGTAVPKPVAIRDWTPLVPASKRAALAVRNLATGHPGR